MCTSNMVDAWTISTQTTDKKKGIVQSKDSEQMYSYMLRLAKPWCCYLQDQVHILSTGTSVT